MEINFAGLFELLIIIVVLFAAPVKIFENIKSRQKPFRTVFWAIAFLFAGAMTIVSTENRQNLIVLFVAVPWIAFCTIWLMKQAYCQIQRLNMPKWQIWIVASAIAFIFTGVVYLNLAGKSFETIKFEAASTAEEVVNFAVTKITEGLTVGANAANEPSVVIEPALTKFSKVQNAYANAGDISEIAETVSPYEDSITRLATPCLTEIIHPSGTGSKVMSFPDPYMNSVVIGDNNFVREYQNGQEVHVIAFIEGEDALVSEGGWIHWDRLPNFQKDCQ